MAKYELRRLRIDNSQIRFYARAAPFPNARNPCFDSAPEKPRPLFLYIFSPWLIGVTP